MAIKINNKGKIIQIGKEDTGFEISGMALINNRTPVPKNGSLKIYIPTWANYILITIVVPGLDAADTTTYKPQYLGSPLQLISLTHMEETRLYGSSSFYIYPKTISNQLTSAVKIYIKKDANQFYIDFDGSSYMSYTPIIFALGATF